ncbi:Ctf8p PWA37_000443 [Arxiozyma heterogenica]|uniref:Uncharacterized protein n=1 Tax=Arxiozyma heterogenica TaxID=278026 RepID=A0AAN7WFC2_9SACH|nr:hypothetical protein RI543_003969 [Kazachstania heterogenica]
MHVQISISELLSTINNNDAPNENNENNENINTSPLTIMTPLGRTIVEIQGDLEISTNMEVLQDQEIRFGLLDIEENIKDPVLSRVTLYVGQKQRILGKIVSLETPLGLLKFDKINNNVILEDVIQYKILFQDRPLPIM